MNRYQDKNYLKQDQYKTSKNLDARAELHRRFSTAVTPWQPWVFDQMALAPHSRVLECGCGPGWLWRENVDRIPSGCHITLTDLSPGMVAEAEAALAQTGHAFTFRVASIDDLPFIDDSFDVVVANHMLYHVPDRARALAEVRRVLRANGRFLAATNGQNHMRELTELGQALLPESVKGLEETRLQRRYDMSLSFRLENGREQLAPYFDHIELIPYLDSLEITEAEPLLAYALSTIDQDQEIPQALRAQVLADLKKMVAEQGAIHITKHTGLFLAR